MAVCGEEGLARVQWTEWKPLQSAGLVFQSLYLTQAVIGTSIMHGTGSIPGTDAVPPKQRCRAEDGCGGRTVH